MTYDSVIVDSHVMLPTGMVDKNIVIDNGRIVAITSDVPSCDNKIKGSGLVSIPGMIDTHTHYGVYSPIDKAANTESHAAAIGGVTTMMRMLRLEGSYKNLLQAHLDASVKSHYIDYTIHASIFNQNQIDEMEYIKQQGISSFKIYMNLGSDIGHVYMDMQPGSSQLHSSQVELNNHIVEKIVEMAARIGCPVCVHAEDYESCSCGMKTAQEKDQDGLSAWSCSRLPESEAKAIKIISEYGRKYNCVIYFVHIGSDMALKQIITERNNGTKIFVETCPQYLTLSYEKQNGYLAKVMPPIRTQNDIEKVWWALNHKIIDTIGTDHVANQLKLKLDGTNIWSALAGFPGIGTALPLLLSEGINKQRITLDQLIRVSSLNAAKIFSMYPKKGTLEVGSDADITMIDLKKELKVSNELFGGFSDYSVYEGWNLKGWPVQTIVRGKTISKDFEVIGKLGWGELVKRPV
jgi:dihydropyrimidinase